MKQSYRIKSRDVRTILCLLSVMLLGYVWISTYFQLVAARAEAITDAQRDVQNYTRSFEEHTVRTIQMADQATVFFSERYNDLGVRLDIAAYLKNGVVLGDILNQIAIVDAEANLVLSSLPMQKMNLSDREHIRTHMQQDSGRLFISKPILGRISKKWSLQMTRRITRPDGSFNGVVVASVDPFYFTRFYEDINLGKDGVIVLVGEDGIVRARRTTTMSDINQDISKGSVFQAALNNSSGRGGMTTSSVLDGKERLYAYRKLKNYALFVVVGIGTEDALSAYSVRKSETIRLALITSVLILSFTAFAVIMFGRMLRSQRLTMAADANKSILLADLEQRQQELTASTERLNTILQNAADAVITTNADGDIESFNHAAELIFGVSAGDIVGRNMNQLIRAFQPQDWQAPELQALPAATGIRNDGQFFPLEITVSKVSLLGQDKFILIARDITERRKVERMQQEFISTVSHELRTPLTAIRGSLGLIVGGVTGELPAKAAQLAAMAYANTERLTRLINDLLDVQKMESGDLSLTLVTLPLAPLINEALEANQAFAHRLEVNIRLASATPAVNLYVDAGRFQQVMANLLSNACKYSNQGGVVSIVMSQPSADKIRIAVIDQGSGIPEQFQHRIFQKFAQADSSDTKSKGGSGLGLSITKAIVLQMHGSISYQSVIGEGSCFFVDLPASAASET